MLDGQNSETGIQLAKMNTEIHLIGNFCNCTLKHILPIRLVPCCHHIIILVILNMSNGFAVCGISVIISIVRFIDCLPHLAYGTQVVETFSNIVVGKNQSISRNTVTFWQREAHVAVIKLAT